MDPQPSTSVAQPSSSSGTNMNETPTRLRSLRKRSVSHEELTPTRRRKRTFQPSSSKEKDVEVKDTTYSPDINPNDYPLIVDEEDDSKKKIGFIGSTDLSTLLIKRLVDNYSVYVWAQPLGKCKELLKFGARARYCPADVYRAADIIFSCVPDSDTALENIFDQNGISSVNGTGKTYVEMSCLDKKTLKDIESIINKTGGNYLEVAMHGGYDEAAKGRLMIHCAGHEKVFDIVKPYLSAFGHRIVYMREELGIASALTNLYKSYELTCLATIAELKSHVRESGAKVSDGQLLDILKRIPYFVSPYTIENIQHSRDPSGCIKDPVKYCDRVLEMTRDIAHANDQFMPVTAATNDYFRWLNEFNFGVNDKSFIFQLFEN